MRSAWMGQTVQELIGECCRGGGVKVGGKCEMFSAYPTVSARYIHHL